MSNKTHKDGHSDEMAQSHDNTSRRKFIKRGIQGIALLPYVAPIIETYFIDDAHANGDGDGSGSGSGGGGRGRGKGSKVTPPPGRGRGTGGGSGSGSGGDD
jgi:hypothetical protein